MQKLSRVFLVVMMVLTTSAVLPQDEPVTVHNAAPDGNQYAWTLITDELDSPLLVTNAGDGTNRLFAVEQAGLILVIENGVLNPLPFLDISSLMPRSVFLGGYTEQGLLGLAFHPDYETNGQFFINYTDVNGDTVVARYTVSAGDPNQADPASAVTLLTQDQPDVNHNGGHMVFGPDGYLYIGFGDGGSQGDPNGYTQNPQSLLGKMLRIDVNADTYSTPADNLYASDPAFLPEIWALGLRNPWRFSFDRATDDLYIADVGQWEVEEVNFIPAGEGRGYNYGWNIYEGDARLSNAAGPANLVFPVVTYHHDEGCSITGGFVYRGEAMPELQGFYFYGDYCVGRLWVAWRDDVNQWQSNVFMDTGRQVSSFGEDEVGELYMVDYKGEILRLEHKS